MNLMELMREWYLSHNLLLPLVILLLTFLLFCVSGVLTLVYCHLAYINGLIREQSEEDREFEESFASAPEFVLTRGEIALGQICGGTAAGVIAASALPAPLSGVSCAAVFWVAFIVTFSIGCFLRPFQEEEDDDL